jgi:cell division protein FtsQ
MAVNLNPSIKHKVQPLFAQPDQFRRNRERIKSSKMYRKVKLRFGHIFLSFILLGGFFFGLQQAYLYLITSDEFKVKDVEIECRNDRIRTDVKAFIQGKDLGSIILLDMQKLKQTISSHAWIKDVRIRKLFPSALKISIDERVPSAVLKQKKYILIDKEGAVLAESSSMEWPHLPLLTDGVFFQKQKRTKLELAWKCLEELEPGQKERIETLDLSLYNNVTVKLKNQTVRLILGDGDFSQKISTYLKNQRLFSQYSEIKSIDLRFGDRFILTPWDQSAGIHHSGDRKEES